MFKCILILYGFLKFILHISLPMASCYHSCYPIAVFVYPYVLLCLQGLALNLLVILKLALVIMSFQLSCWSVIQYSLVLIV